MKNNKGQSLVLFILLLPILIGILSLVIDGGRMYLMKVKQENILELVLNNSLSKEKKLEKDQIEKLLQKNYKDGTFKINLEKETIYLQVSDEIEGIFSKLFSFVRFPVRTEYKGYLQEEKVKIEKIT